MFNILIITIKNGLQNSRGALLKEKSGPRTIDALPLSSNAKMKPGRLGLTASAYHLGVFSKPKKYITNVSPIASHPAIIIVYFDAMMQRG